MMIPGILAQRRQGGVVPVLWTPLSMSTVPAIYLDVHDSVVTDVSGSASSVTNLGSLGADGNFSQATAGNQPLILNNELNGKRVLRFDGSNDVLVCTSTAARDIFRNKQAAWAFFVAKKRGADMTPTARYMLYAATGGSAARFAVMSGLNGAGQANRPSMYARRADADSVSTLVGPDPVSGGYEIVLARATYATRFGSIMRNGVAVAANATFTSAGSSTSDTAATIDLSIGGYYTGALGSDSDIAAVIVGNSDLSLEDAQRLEGWAAHRFDLAANLPPSHPYKASPPMV